MAKRSEMWQAEVLGIIQKATSAMSAYDVLDALRLAHPKVAPTTVYRALAVLTEQSQVHRIESLNAFVACQCDSHGHTSVMSICDDCGTVEEKDAPEIAASLSDVLGESGFAPSRHVIEVHGTCASCGPQDTAQ